MKIVTSSLTFSFYIAIALIILVSVSDKAHAKRGCASFGHSCFGGHGKRFDSAMQQNMLQASNRRNFQESEVSSPNDELFYVLPSDGFRERSEQAFMRARKDTQQQFDLNPLSSLVNQWIASHRRSHRTDSDVTNK
ncbi:neuropeptide CCHamide-2 isoform X2 [Ooceraea biroi]|uniref:neuropeptide CCHamide-2 isoform X2 n=1 Tax=Ooceraea biroi TaxID=2015173 RepID=UPI0005B7D356|nr:neuropeptide CCHamide-2 isoform X2 [Ooceraea biroi]